MTEEVTEEVTIAVEEAMTALTDGAATILLANAMDFTILVTAKEVEMQPLDLRMQVLRCMRLCACQMAIEDTLMGTMIRRNEKTTPNKKVSFFEIWETPQPEKKMGNDESSHYSPDREDQQQQQQQHHDYDSQNNLFWPPERDPTNPWKGDWMDKNSKDRNRDRDLIGYHPRDEQAENDEMYAIEQ